MFVECEFGYRLHKLVCRLQKLHKVSCVLWIEFCNTQNNFDFFLNGVLRGEYYCIVRVTNNAKFVFWYYHLWKARQCLPLFCFQL